MRSFPQSLSAISITLALSLWSSTALAQATDEGAAELLAVFQTYFGTADGVVAVAIDGDDYAVTIDPAPLLAKIPAEGMTMTVTPLTLSVTDNGDGTWAYDLDQPVTIGSSIPGQLDAKTEYGNVKLTGIFDEALGDSSEYRLEFTDVTTEQTQTDPTLGKIVVKGKVDSTVFEGTAAAGVIGLDSQFTSTSTGLGYDVNLPAGEGAAPMMLTVSIPEGTGDGSLKGYQAKAIYGLVAWFVAHPDAALIEADKAGLKTQIETALPIFESMSITGSYKSVLVSSPLGEFGVADMGVALDMNGLVADGKLREAISFSGLTLPEGVVPPFAVSLVPSDITLDFAVSKFDLAAAAGLGLGLLDLPAGAETPADYEMNMMTALMPQGAVDITIAPGVATAPAYTLTYEGAMSAGPATPMPVGTAKVTLKGMAEVNAALMASPPEMGLQDMAPMLGLAESMAKPGDDGALVWDIETTAAGGVLINGTDMMGGGQ